MTNEAGLEHGRDNIDPTDLSEPYPFEGKWFIDEQLYPEARGTRLWEFDTEEQAKAFIAEAGKNHEKEETPPVRLAKQIVAKLQARQPFPLSLAEEQLVFQVVGLVHKSHPIK